MITRTITYTTICGIGAKFAEDSLEVITEPFTLNVNGTVKAEDSEEVVKEKLGYIKAKVESVESFEEKRGMELDDFIKLSKVL